MISDQAIINLHKKFARTDSDFQLIYTHSIIVDEIASKILDSNGNLNIDREILHVACMLHDVGAYEVIVDGKFVDGVRHGVIGERILRDENLPEEIWAVASHHTGVGLSKADVIEQKLNIPAEDYTAKNDLQRLVMYADKFHSKSNPPAESPYFCTFRWYRNNLKKFGADKAVKFDELARQFGIPNLVPLSEKYGYKLVDFS